MKESWENLQKWLYSLPYGFGKGGYYLFVSGFIVILVAAIIAWIDSAVGLAILAPGLALISIGIGLISVGASMKGDIDKKCLENEGSGDIKATSAERESVERRLARIEEKIDKMAVDNRTYSTYFLLLSTGIASILAGITMLGSEGDYPSYGTAISIIGLVAILVSSVAISAKQHRLWLYGIFGVIYAFILCAMTILLTDISKTLWAILIFFGYLMLFWVLTWLARNFTRVGTDEETDSS